MERVRKGAGLRWWMWFRRYKAPARYDDELVIQTRLVAARGPIVRFGYRIVREADGAVLCEGETTQTS